MSKEQEAKAREQEERRQHMISQIMTADARERLARVALVKPERAREIENNLIQAAQRGALSSPVDDDHLVRLLNGMNDAKKPTKIVMARKSALDDD